MTLAERIADYRRQPPGVSLRAMAKELGISTAYLSEIERGRKMPQEGTLAKFAEFFGVTVDQLWTGKLEPRIMQISALAISDGSAQRLKVVCLLSDGSLHVRDGGQCVENGEMVQK